MKFGSSQMEFISPPPHGVQMCVHLHQSACAHMKARDESPISSPLTLHLIFWDNVSYWAQNLPFQMDCAVREPLRSCFTSCAGEPVILRMIGLLVGVGDTAAGPYAGVTITLPPNPLTSSDSCLARGPIGMLLLHPMWAQGRKMSLTREWPHRKLNLVCCINSSWADACSHRCVTNRAKG